MRTRTADTDPQMRHANTDGDCARENVMTMATLLITRRTSKVAEQVILLDMLGALPIDMIPTTPSLRHFVVDLLTEGLAAARYAQSKVLGDYIPATLLPARVVDWLVLWALNYAGDTGPKKLPPPPIETSGGQLIEQGDDPEAPRG